MNVKARGLKPILGRVVLLVGSLVILAGFGELALRFGLPLIKPRFTRVDRHLGWYHNASVGKGASREGHAYQLSYNNHGFRPPDRSFDKPPGRRRIVVLGDSFVDGSEVGDDELFTWKLDERFDSLEVINLGVYGYSTAQEFVMLKRFGLKYEPELVVLVTLPNDFAGNHVTIGDFGPAPTFVLEDGELRFRDTEHSWANAQFRKTNLPLPGARFLHEHSHLYYAINHYIYQRLRSERIVQIRSAEEASVGSETRSEIYRGIVNRMHELCRSNGVRFAVVLIYEEDELLEHEMSPNSEIADALRRDGVKVIDMFDDLKRAQLTAAESLYYERDIHWNAAGHAAVASMLEPRLAELLSLE